ncbi:MAG: hypothetical protein KDB63_00070 [Nocardioidaceae bacterium]|nr:hypothetical protein [Nocardioidaceae bacterium]
MHPRPRDLSRAFFVIAALLVPWTVYLLLRLPRHYDAHHYRLSWVGFDLALVAALIVTGIALARRSPALSRYAAGLSIMLVIDAWFDVLNAGTTTDRVMAVAAAVFIELPLAYLCWQLARAGEHLQGPDRPVTPR